MPSQPYQAFKFGLPDDLSAKMIEKSRHTPQQARATILEEGLHSLGVLSQSPATFGLSIDPRMVSIPVRTLGNPTLEYRQSQKAIPDERAIESKSEKVPLNAENRI